MGKFVKKTNTGEGVKGKRVRTNSDDAGGISVSGKSKSAGGKSGVIRISGNPFEVSRSDKPNPTLGSWS